MKATLHTIDDLSNKVKSFKKKREKTSLDATDTELERQLQNEVKLFLNSTKVDNNTTKKKNSKKQIDDNESNNMNDYKLLNQSKYATKLLKKSKLKENNQNKLEKRIKKRKALKGNHTDNIQGDVDVVLDPSIKIGEAKIHERVKTKKQKEETQEKTHKVLSGRIKKKKEEKMKLYEMKRLHRKFDNMNISQDSTSSSNAAGKRRRNKSRKLLKKEKLLRTLLKGNREAEIQVGKNRPSIETLKKQIESLKKDQPESKKAKKRKLQNVQSEDNQMEVDLEKTKQKFKKTKEDKKEKRKKKRSKKNADNVNENDKLVTADNQMELDLENTKSKNTKEEKKGKKKKSKSQVENADTENERPTKKRKPNQPDEEMEEVDCSSNGVVSNGLEPQASGAHKREKYFNSKNTPLRERLMNKLKAARFRYLNEQMYTSKSGESKDFFLQDPESFEAYHEGFKQQVAQWPINPVDVIIKSLQERESSTGLVIADMGCGEAKLASCLEQHKVHSLDLVALNDRVTPCDMTRTPLKSGSVDVVVFCLSLMGTDLAACVKEANRILKMGGEMKIADVESRFHDVKEFVKDIEKYGFESKAVNMEYSIFCFLDLKKVSKTKKKKLPDLKLKPCLYKKR